MSATAADRKFAHRIINEGRALPWLTTDRLIDMQFWRQGNMTIAEVTAKPKQGKNPIVLVGVSKRNPNADYEDTHRGREIALARALRGEAEAL